MKLKRMIDDINEVPEALRDYYTKEGDAYVLDSDDRNLRDKISEFRTNNIDLRKKIEEMQAQNEKYKDLDPAKAEEAIKRLQEIEEQNLIAADKIDEVLALRTERMRADYDGKITAMQEAMENATGQAELFKTKLSDSMVGSRVAQAIADVGVVRPGAMNDVLNRARQDWIVDEKGELVPMRNGEVIYSKDGDAPITIEDWSADLYKEASYFFEPNTGGGSGGGARGGPGGQVKQVNLSDQDGLNSNLADIASGKVAVVDG